MKIRNNRWINAEVQALIGPQPISLIIEETENMEECNIIKIKMRQDPASATSETYKLKVLRLNNDKP